MSKQDEKETVEEKDQEPVEANSVTSKILSRYDVKTTSQDQDEKGDKDNSDNEVDPAVIDEEQEDEQEQDVELTEQEISALEDAGIDEKELEGKTFGEIKELAQSKMEQQDTDVEDTSKKKPSTENSQEPIVTEAYAKTYPIAKSFVGQPMSVLLYAMGEQNKYIEKLEKGGKPKPNSQLNENEDQLSEEDAVDLLSLKPDEQAKKLNELIQAKASAIVKEELATFKSQLAPLEVQSEEASMNQIYAELQKSLPENVTLEETKNFFDEWTEKAKTTYSEAVRTAFATDPSYMIEQMSRDFKLKDSKKKIKEKEKEITKEKSKKYTNLRSQLKRSAKLGKNDAFNFKRKGKEGNDDLLSEEGSEGEQMIGRILKRNL